VSSGTNGAGTPSSIDSATRAGRGTSGFPKRFGSETPKRGSGLTTPSSQAFALGSGSGAFSFGSGTTPKTPGANLNPFESNFGTNKTPVAERPAATTSAGAGVGDDPAVPAAATLQWSTSKAPSMASISEASVAPESQVPPPVHPLKDGWSFWFRPPLPKGMGYVDYEKTLHGIATVHTIEEFLAVFTHLKRPSLLPPVSELPPVSDYHLFKSNIRPIWEDDTNKKGGKWVVRMKKGVADRYWEELMFALVGDQFGDLSAEVCGAVLSVRNGEDTLSIWIRTEGPHTLKIR